MKPNLDESSYGISGPVIVVPKQTLNLQPVVGMMGVQVQQLKVVAQQPTRLVTPINVQRTPVGGNFQYSVQFMRDPTDPTYASTSVLIKTAVGTTALQASSGNGPIVYTAPRVSAPSSLATQVNTTAGTSTSTSFGSGNSRKLNQS